MPLRGQTHSFERRGAKVALCWQCNGRLGRGRQKLGGGSLVAWRRASGDGWKLASTATVTSPCL